MLNIVCKTSDMENMKIKNSIEITADASKVWDILTRPEETKKYMFGCETVSDWKPGSELLWKGTYEGKEMLFVTGYIKEIDPPSLLKYSVIDPNASYEKTPENHLDVTYELVRTEGETVLTATQEGFEHAAEGEKRYKEAYNNGEGWNPILVQIKKIAEEG